MTEMLPIRTVTQYFNELIVKGLEGKTKVNQIDLIPIKNAILKAFKEEVFGQIYFKLGDEAKNMPKDDLAKVGFVNNILTQTFRKWRRLCILCGEYGLGSFFQLDDLQNVLDDENAIEEDPEETVYAEDAEGEDVTDKLDEILPPGEEPVYFEQDSKQD